MKPFRFILAIALVLLAGQFNKATALTLTNLYSFGNTNGALPAAALVQGHDGFFYGACVGGVSSNCNNGCGTLFRFGPAGAPTNLYSATLTNLYSFYSFNGSNYDGYYPEASLVQGTNGAFYGTTAFGGSNSYGTVFEVTTNGMLTNIYVFAGTDGAYPERALLKGYDRNFYGTTYFGGGGSNVAGTVFRITPNGVLSNLHFFIGPEGAYPKAGLVQGVDSNFYGTTYLGGASNYGTVFQMSPSGVLTDLYSFAFALYDSSNYDGAYPEGTLVRGVDGNFYGATYYGGTYTNGTVFRISPSGVFTSLHSFKGPDGSFPEGGLMQGSDGNFYGTTYAGGIHSNGAVFRIAPSGDFTNLLSFSGPDGSYPEGKLVQGIDGYFYGTTSLGGYTNLNSGLGYGTVFEIIVNLTPPANQISAINVVGTNVFFTIASVAPETYQLQTRTSMTFGVWLDVPGICVSNSIGGPLIVTNIGGATSPQQFYHFSITP